MGNWISPFILRIWVCRTNTNEIGAATYCMLWRVEGRGAIGLLHSSCVYGCAPPIQERLALRPIVCCGGVEGGGEMGFPTSLA